MTTYMVLWVFSSLSTSAIAACLLIGLASGLLVVHALLRRCNEAKNDHEKEKTFTAADIAD